ncbi:hypothetical protein PanWU01x14_224340 [Parasponia andersonii]|uniref:Uncharacterized protein n=1 Tax=Parasponia andersonii TaxID=3476 RepID=A0A2P5BN61_PARAD|nr:hypothetical protein PanWU01x14_224340 [Parasponia andersonii]
MVNSGAYLSSGSSSSQFEDMNSYTHGTSLSSRGIREPMNPFVVDLDEDDDEKSPSAIVKTITLATTKEH